MELCDCLAKVRRLRKEKQAKKKAKKAAKKEQKDKKAEGAGRPRVLLRPRLPLAKRRPVPK